MTIEDISKRPDVSPDALVATWETAALYYAYGRFDAGEEDLFDHEIEEFALAYARSCATGRYTPVQRFYADYLRGRRRPGAPGDR